MVNILNEVCIDLGGDELMEDETLILWLVSYGGEAEEEVIDRWTKLLDTLDASLRPKGGYVETREDPVSEHQCSLFSSIYP